MQSLLTRPRVRSLVGAGILSASTMELARTQVGSPAYMAPEIIHGAPYSYKASATGFQPATLPANCNEGCCLLTVARSNPIRASRTFGRWA